jgi:uncharacterized membrane protein (DUF373 family)
MTWFERIIISALILLMAATVFFSAVDLAWLLIKELIAPPCFRMDVNRLLDTFGLFLLVLIGLELLDTFEAYLEEHVIHVEVVFMVAMIAIARKVIILDVKELPSATLLGIAAIVITLSGGYYLFKRAFWEECRLSDERQRALAKRESTALGRGDTPPGPRVLDSVESLDR